MTPRLREWLVTVEREWLGWSLPPPRRAVEELGWAPDDPSRYCARCGSSVGPGEATDGGCASCRRVAVATDAVVRLGPYAGPLREWVRAIKYRGWAEMAELLGARLGVVLKTRRDYGAEPVLVVPMPMPWQRRIYRGIDHARLVAAAVAAELATPVVPLLSMDNGPPQVSLGAGRRARRAVRMRVRPRYSGLRLDRVRVVLVDDVRTTGASLNGAARMIRRLGPRGVEAAVLAVTEDRSRLDRGPMGPQG